MHTVYGVALPKVYILVHFWQRGDVPKVGYFRDIPDEFKIKSLYSNDLILNIASKSKETVQKLKFLDSPIDSDITSGIRAATENPRRAKSTPAVVFYTRLVVSERTRMSVFIAVARFVLCTNLVVEKRTRMYASQQAIFKSAGITGHIRRCSVIFYRWGKNE